MAGRASQLMRRAAGRGARILHKEQVWAELDAAVNPDRRRALRDAIARKAILAATLREDSNAVDVGANRGSVLAELVRLAPRGAHVAFEPIPALARHLQETYMDVEVHAAAVTAKTGTARFHHYPDNSGFSGLRPSALVPDEVAVEIEVPTVRLDDVVEAHRPVDLIKIDVEGAELDVLESARRTLERDRPVVLFEHGARGDEPDGDEASRRIAALFDDCGYRIFDLEANGPYDGGRFAALFEQPIWDCVAVPVARRVGSG